MSEHMHHWHESQLNPPNEGTVWVCPSCSTVSLVDPSNLTEPEAEVEILHAEIAALRSKTRVFRVWYHTSEPERVHYTVIRADGSLRHLWEPRSTAWGKVLCKQVES
jgi:hypothetical protein